MLLALRLRDFVIVDALDIEFGPGFTTLTGETGAGKSILLDALSLAMGGRADAGVVREGAPRADISATFRSSEALDAWLAERALAGDPGCVLLRRVIDAEGRSRALINGNPATAALLRELGEQLVDIHGQHAAQSLLRADGQRQLLDAYAGLADDARALGEAWSAWRTLARDLEATEGGQRELALERDRLAWQAGELERLRLAPGEWDALNEEQKRLSHAASLIEGTRGAAEALSDNDDALSSRLHQLLHRLRPLAAIDERLREALDLLDGAAIQIDEAASALAAYADRVDLDPARLEQTEQRIGAVFEAARRLRLSPADIPAELEAMQQRLQQLEAAQDLDALRARMQAARKHYDTLATALSAARRKAATRLSEGVSQHLAGLGMAGGRLQIACEPTDPSASGIDQVEFRVAAHAGATPRPLAKVASGGELSRIGLAISVMAAQANPVPTLIFDEADAGVGGAVADAIGELMRRLGDDRQVLCVTHLPQVAAKAHQHFRVSKETVGAGVCSRIEELDRGARVEELARMLGGAGITATTRKHARELLAQA
ncbi:DNA repair protein RecN [Quisquiliibacterium transsilvanicum]|uniref:DNA repair protein RecN n=1 Tax=Quisquiliibacterium transsilvanicum TaxID=1549638 RepID=A0A7W8HFB6_9BURK|nr:DNA repair protein RecN [Quisquiliibacterium transsilvanicum]MBB5270961.1 DNA repair protein RecN (Recombination protein N) [Quisquiliibacterium transsilvanicum]